VATGIGKQCTQSIHYLCYAWTVRIETNDADLAARINR
jgi:hypothetical protein